MLINFLVSNLFRIKRGLPSDMFHWTLVSILVSRSLDSDPNGKYHHQSRILVAIWTWPLGVCTANDVLGYSWHRRVLGSHGHQRLLEDVLDDLRLRPRGSHDWNGNLLFDLDLRPRIVPTHAIQRSDLWTSCCWNSCCCDHV